MGKFKGLFKKHHDKGRSSLIFTAIVSLTCVFTGGVCTFAWFQASAAATVSTTSSTADITVSKPSAAKFYYFTGNGTPGGDYPGYSRSDSVIGSSATTITYNAASPTNPTNVGFDSTDGKTYYFQEITGSGVYTANNCFNLSKIRPGCYYTYCVEYDGANAGLNISFTNTISGEDTVPKKKVYDLTPYYVSLGLALNGAVSTPQGKSFAAEFIKNSFGTTTSNDKIVYPTYEPASDTFTAPYASSQNMSTNHFLFFSIFMGFNDKADALTYRSKSGTGSDEYLLYNRDQSAGDYSALNGMQMSINTIELTI